MEVEEVPSYSTLAAFGLDATAKLRQRSEVVENATILGTLSLDANAVVDGVVVAAGVVGVGPAGVCEAVHQVGDANLRGLREATRAHNDGCCLLRVVAAIERRGAKGGAAPHTQQTEVGRSGLYEAVLVERRIEVVGGVGVEVVAVEEVD